jgi:hypothetical protein
MSVVEQRAAGVDPGMVRLSVGIEHIDDIWGDLDQALEAMNGAAAEAPEAAALKEDGCRSI